MFIAGLCTPTEVPATSLDSGLYAICSGSMLNGSSTLDSGIQDQIPSAWTGRTVCEACRHARRPDSAGVFSGDPAIWQPRSPKADRDATEPKPAGTFQNDDIYSVENEDIREIGAEWLCKQALDYGGIWAVLESVGIKGKALDSFMLAWISCLMLLGSELATAAWLREHSCLPELHGMQHEHKKHRYKVGNRSCKQKFE